MKEPMTVLVTGASSGLGLHTAQQLAAAGMTVIAGARSFSGDEKDGMHRLKLDVTDDASCEAFVEAAKRISPRIDAIVHCAGILILGTCEETSTEEYRRVMETDFLGMVRMNRLVLPLFRAQGRGRIVMFSSINGLLGIPCQSAYTAAKHAVEGYAECLQMEARRFGIEVCLIEPGDHRSGSSAYRRHAEAMNPASPYAEDVASATAVIHRDETGGSDPDRLGRKVAGVLRRRRMPVRKRIAKPDQHLAVWLHDLLPPGLNGAILRSYYFGHSELSDKKSAGKTAE